MHVSNINVGQTAPPGVSQVASYPHIPQYTAASPVLVHPIQQPGLVQAPIPLIQLPKEAGTEAGSPQIAGTPIATQMAFQPVQLNMMPPMGQMITQGQMIPQMPQMMVTIQTPNGPVFQPVYPVAQFPEQFQPCVVTAPEQHPVQQAELHRKKFASRSTSFDGSERSVSDSGDNKYFATSLQRHSSEISLSRDGYGSDTFVDNRSRLGSEHFTEGSEIEEEESPKKASPMELCSPKTPTFNNSFFMQPRRSITPESNQRYITLNHSKSFERRSSHGSAKRPTSKERQEELYKTELCNYWINSEKCRFGKRCIFAHGQHELRMPKRKLERKRLQAPLRKQIHQLLSKLNENNFETLCTELLCAVVEDVRDNERDSNMVVKTIFNRVVSQDGASKMRLIAEAWKKMLNVHPMCQTFAAQMCDMCMNEYEHPKHKSVGLQTMLWVAELCKQKVVTSQDLMTKILSDMFNENQSSEQKVEMWCKLIEALKNTVDTSKYFEPLSRMKTKSSSRIRYMIMDLEDSKKRHWVTSSRQ